MVAIEERTKVFCEHCSLGLAIMPWERCDKENWLKEWEFKAWKLKEWKLRGNKH